MQVKSGSGVTCKALSQVPRNLHVIINLGYVKRIQARPHFVLSFDYLMDIHSGRLVEISVNAVC